VSSPSILDVDALVKLLQDVLGNTEKKQALLDAMTQAPDEPK